MSTEDGAGVASPRGRCSPAVALVLALHLTGASALAQASCTADCNQDGEVTVNEIIAAVNVALGEASLSLCQAADANGDAEITVDEIVAAVGYALEACPDEPLPTPTATATATVAVTPTPTRLVDDQNPPVTAAALRAWLMQGRYKSWHAESAPHQSGGPHGGTVHTYLNNVVFDSLSAGNAEHPKGAAVVKELYFGGATVAEWAVEIKLEDTSNSGQNWYWYEGLGLQGRGLRLCTGCHGSDYRGGGRTFTSRDYVLTPFPLE